MNAIKERFRATLRSSERYFKTDMVYLARGSFWLNGSQIVTTLSSFALALLFSRLVPKEVYGNYKYILSLAGLVATFSLTGLSSAVLQSVARGFPGTFVIAVKTLARWNSLIFAVAIGGAVYYIAHGNLTLGYGLVTVAILFPAIRTFEIYESYLNGRKDFRRSALYRGTVDIGTIIATALTLLFTDSALALVTINLSAQFVLNVILFNKIYGAIAEEDKNKIEPGIIEFGKHLSFQNIMSNVAAYTDKVLIFHYLGAAEVAIYAFATAIPQQIKGIISNLSLLIIPKISQKTAREAVSAIRSRFLLSLLFLIPIVALYIIFAPLIFKLLFPAYSDAVTYTRWYSLVLLLMGNLSGLILTTQKAVKEQYILMTFASTSQIVLMLLFVHKYSILGIIWAMLLAKFATAVLSFILARRLATRTAL